MNNKRNGRYWNDRGGPSYIFPAWNYGCTLGNNQQTGAYETYYEQREPQGQEVPIIRTPESSSEDKIQVNCSEGNEAIEEFLKSQREQSDRVDSAPEKPIQDILNGRNPIVFCNEQSKVRGLSMEWDQISESGPPHMKVFKWCLKVGDLSVEASANSKKGAKNKAAEEMARKLDQLPKPKKRTHQQMMGYPPGYPVPTPPMIYDLHSPMMFPPNMYGGPPWTNKAPRPPKKKKPNEDKCKTPNPSQDNPISQLYEYCKRIKSPEPIFTTVCENTLESRKTDRGFFRKKLEFTIEVDVIGKKFEGTAMTKKEAKHRAAGIAWTKIQEELKAKGSSV